MYQIKIFRSDLFMYSFHWDINNIIDDCLDF